MVYFIFFAQICDNAGKKRWFAGFVTLQMASAPHPHPFALAVSGTVFDTVTVCTAVCYFLIGLKKGLFIQIVNPCPPNRSGVFDHLAGKVKLLHHGLGITEGVRLHIAHIDIIIRTLDQRIVKMFFIIAKGLCPPLLFSLLLVLFFCLLNVEQPFFLIHFLINICQNLCDGPLVIGLNLLITTAEVHFVELLVLLLKKLYPLSGTPHLFLRGCEISILENNDKLITAQPECVILRRQAFLNIPGNGLQQNIAFCVSISIIDLLKVVDIIHTHNHPDFIPFCLAERMVQRQLSGPPVQQLGQLVGGSRLFKLAGSCMVYGLLEMNRAPVCPLHKAVIIFIGNARSRIFFLPDNRRVLVLILQKPGHRTERTGAFHPLLKNLPADFPLRLFNFKGLLHCLVHKEYFVGLNIGDINICAGIVHHLIENIPLKGILLITGTVDERHADRGRH